MLKTLRISVSSSKCRNKCQRGIRPRRPPLFRYVRDVLGLILIPFWNRLWDPWVGCGQPKRSKDSPQKRNKCEKERSKLAHFHVVFRRPKAAKEELKLELKRSPNRENPSQDHCWTSFWPLAGSIVEALLSNAFQAQDWTPPGWS